VLAARPDLVALAPQELTTTGARVPQPAEGTA
jgi:hypothetical protein